MKIPKKNNYLYMLLFLILLLIILISFFNGAVKIDISKINTGIYNDVLKLRLARIWLGLIAGAGLGISGLLLQGILRNPLAEPYVLGISSGSALGAVISIVIAKGGMISAGLLPLVSFIFGILTMLLILFISRSNGRIPIQALLLSGVIIGAVFSSLLLLIISVSQSSMIHDAIWWLLGNLEIFNMKLLFVISIIVIICVLSSYYFSKDLNAILLGEEEAVHLGVNVEFVKKAAIIISSLLTSSIVCACGIIGFVGLLIPHIGRLIIGADNRKLIPMAVLLGGIFLISCDTIARIVLLPAEMPIGAITALVGGPFFIYLLKTKGTIHFK